MIPYTAWIQLFVLTLKLFPSFNETDDIQVMTSWKSLESFGMYAKDQAMQVEFISSEHNTPLLAYLLIPWENISISGNNVDISSMLGLPDLLCVTPFAILQERCTPDSGEGDVVLKEKITTFVEELFNIDANSKLLVYEDGFSLGNQYQAISMRRFPYLVDLSIAIPGSAHLDPDFFKNEYSNTMIFVSMVPDRGNVLASWIKGGDAGELTAVISFQDELIQKLEGFITSASSIKKVEERIEFYVKYKAGLLDYLSLEGMDTAIKNFYCDFLRRLLAVPDEPVREIQIDPVFGNYQPKKTPDVVTDYMPEIKEDIEKIPKAELENLFDLLELFEGYKTRAEQNPGKTFEGNVLLGGLPEEYQPSKEELLLAEIGERIRKINDTYSDEDIEEYCDEHGLNYRALEYVKFTFIHYDVMGSGRFFYVNSRDSVRFTLP